MALGSKGYHAPPATRGVEGELAEGGADIPQHRAGRHGIDPGQRLRLVLAEPGHRAGDVPAAMGEEAQAAARDGHAHIAAPVKRGAQIGQRLGPLTGRLDGVDQIEPAQHSARRGAAHGISQSNTSGFTAWARIGWPSSTERMFSAVTRAIPAIDSTVTPAICGDSTTCGSANSG